MARLRNCEELTTDLRHIASPILRDSDYSGALSVKLAFSALAIGPGLAEKNVEFGGHVGITTWHKRLAGATGLVWAGYRESQRQTVTPLKCPLWAFTTERRAGGHPALPGKRRRECLPPLPEMWTAPFESTESSMYKCSPYRTGG
jgi:hypothetical protein